MTDAELPLWDVETCRQVVAARAIYWGDRAGRPDEVESALYAAGLDEYKVMRSRRYVLPADIIQQALAFRALVVDLDADADEEDTQEAVQDGLMRHLAWFVTNHLTHEGSSQEKAVNVREVIRTYGARGNIDLVSAEGADELRRIVSTVLAWGEQEEICNDLESALNAIGLSPYLPPRTVKVKVQLHPDDPEFTVDIATNRRGEPDLDRLGVTIRDYVTMALNRGTVLVSTVVE